MKIIALILLLSFSVSAAKPSKQLLFCSYKEAKRLKSVYKKKTGLRDKTIHCALSCKVAYKCSQFGSWNMGLFKELSDLFGDGNAEVEDLKANAYGIRLSQVISNKQQCDDYCLLKYQP